VVTFSKSNLHVSGVILYSVEATDFRSNLKFLPRGARHTFLNYAEICLRAQLSPSVGFRAYRPYRRCIYDLHSKHWPNGEPACRCIYDIRSRKWRRNRSAITHTMRSSYKNDTPQFMRNTLPGSIGR